MTQNVLHVLNLDTVGGVEELFMHFLTAPSELHHHVLITGEKPHPFFEKKLNAFAKSITCEKYLLGCKLPRAWRSYKRKQAIQKARADTIVLWNRIESLDTFRKVAPKASIIYYEHGASWIERKKESPFFQSIDTILVNSFAAKRVLELKWNVTKPIQIIHNPLKPTIKASTHGKKAQTSFVVGFIGRLIPLKGAVLVLHAVQILAERGISVVLQIAGAGPSEEALRNEVKRLHLEKIVQFLGCIEDVSSFYDSIQVLVLPSIREPLGLVAQEAELRGCPVVAAFVDGLPEVVLDGKTGFTLAPTIAIERYHEFGGEEERLPDLVYDPACDILSPPKIVDPHAIAEKLIRLATEPELFEAMSEKAIAFAKRRPNCTEYVEELIATISSPARIERATCRLGGDRSIH